MNGIKSIAWIPIQDLYWAPIRLTLTIFEVQYNKENDQSAARIRVELVINSST